MASTRLRIAVAILAVACVGASVASTTFEKPWFRVVVPDGWADLSTTRLFMFAGPRFGQRLTVSSFSAVRPLSGGELRENMEVLVQARIRSTRMDYADAVFSPAEYSVAGGMAKALLFGIAPGRLQIASILVGSTQGVASFTYVSEALDREAFRAEALEIFQTLSFDR